MSQYYRENGKRYEPEFKDGRTKQSFKDSTDINKILAKAQKTGTISHIAAHKPEYGDFAEFDFLQAQLKLTRGREIFDELPSEVRAEFGQSPAAFFAFVNDPANVDQLERVLPEIAKPGKYFPDVSGRTPQEPVAARSRGTEGGDAPVISEPQSGGEADGGTPA